MFCRESTIILKLAKIVCVFYGERNTNIIKETILFSTQPNARCLLLNDFFCFFCFDIFSLSRPSIIIIIFKNISRYASGLVFRILFSIAFVRLMFRKSLKFKTKYGKYFGLFYKHVYELRDVSIYHGYTILTI